MKEDNSKEFKNVPETGRHRKNSILVERNTITCINSPSDE